MTLAPDHTGYHARGEIDDPATVYIFPIPPFSLCQAPTDAPTAYELHLADRLVRWHLADGWTNGDDEMVTYAHIVSDLDKPINLRAFLALCQEHTEACDQHGTEWPADLVADFEVRVREYLKGQGYDIPAVIGGRAA